MRTIKVFILSLLFIITINAQTIQAPIKISNEHSVVLKKILEKQEILSKEFQMLEQQKVIVIQRVALENNLNAKQLDELELGTDKDGFVLQVKPKSEVGKK